MTRMAKQEIGIVGLATMGQNLARNLASHGVTVAVYNRTRQRTDELMAHHAGEGDFKPAGTLEELVALLDPPRAILLMVMATTFVAPPGLKLLFGSSQPEPAE